MFLYLNFCMDDKPTENENKPTTPLNSPPKETAEAKARKEKKKKVKPSKPEYKPVDREVGEVDKKQTSKDGSEVVPKVEDKKRGASPPESSQKPKAHSLSESKEVSDKKSGPVNESGGELKDLDKKRGPSAPESSQQPKGKSTGKLKFKLTPDREKEKFFPGSHPKSHVFSPSYRVRNELSGVTTVYCTPEDLEATQNGSKDPLSIPLRPSGGVSKPEGVSPPGDTAQKAEEKKKKDKKQDNKKKKEKEQREKPVPSPPQTSQSEDKPEDQREHQIGSDTFKGKIDVASRVSKLCVEQGFKPTGDPVKKFEADFFEKSGVFSIFTENLESKIDKGCNLNASETAAVLDNIHKSKNNAADFVGCVVSGAPGCGKSTLLRRLQSEGHLNSVIILGNPRLKSDFSDQQHCYTVKEILLLKLKIRFKTLLIDEFTLVSSGEILALQRILGSKFVALFGDPNQGKTTYMSSPEWLQFPTVFSSQQSRRFGDNTAKFCQKQGCRFEGNGCEDKVEELDYEGSSQTTDINLAFSQKTIDDLEECGIEAVLVSSVQGCEYNSVSLFIRDTVEDRQGVSDSHQRVVAFTRHTKLLVLRCSQEILLKLVSGELARESPPAQTHLYDRE